MTEPSALSYFDRNAVKYSEWTRASRGFRERRAVFGALIERCRPPAGEPALCLDLGCGGTPIGLLAVDQGYDVIAIDGSAEMLALARRTRAGGGAQIREFRHARLPLDGLSLDELRGRADLVIASSLVEYLSDPDSDELLAQCAQLLKPDGTALISFPNRHSLYWRALRPIGNRGPLRGRAAGVQQRQWSPEQVRDRAAAHGLGLCGSEYFALPLQQYLDSVPLNRSAWLATLFVAVLAPFGVRWSR